MKNNIWRKFYGLLSRYRRTYVILYLTKLANLLFGALLPMILSVFVDEVIYHQQTDEMMMIISLYFILFLLSMVFSACDIIIWQYLSNYLVISIKEKLWNKILKLKMSTFTQYTQAELLQIINDDSRAFVRLINQNLFPFLNAVANTIICLFLIFSIEKYAGLLVIIVIPVIVLLNKKWMKRVSELAKKQRTLSVHLASHFLDISRKLRDIRLLNATHFFEEKIKDKSNQALLANKELAIGQTVAEERISILEGLSRIAMLIVVGYAAFCGKITIGQYIALALYIGKAHDSISTIFNFQFQFSQRRINLTKVFNLLEMEEENLSVGKELTVSKGEITFSNVVFGYTESKRVLSEVGFSVAKGELTGIIGQNGAGKSTLINLLLGLYSSYEGEISIDGTELRELSLKSLRDQIVVVSQQEQVDMVLVKDYFTSLNRDLTEQDILQRLEKYVFCNFLTSSPHLLHTVMGELSGGQVQRIRVAAAMLSNAPILVLDEPSSMVDDQSENDIFLALEEEKYKRTVLVVTHGEKYLKYYDKQIIIGEEERS